MTVAVLLACHRAPVAAEEAPASTTNVTSTTSDATTSTTTPPAEDSSTTTQPGDTTTSTTSGDSTSSSSGGESSSGSSGAIYCACCGNGLLDGSEECDCGDDNDCTPAEMNFTTCEDLSNPLRPGVVYTGGTLRCSPASCRYMFEECFGCGNGTIDPGEACEPEVPTPTCAELGVGTSKEPVPCDPATCQLDTSSCVL